MSKCFSVVTDAAVLFLVLGSFISWCLEFRGERDGRFCNCEYNIPSKKGMNVSRM